jgi:hypothetical protein
MLQITQKKNKKSRIPGRIFLSCDEIRNFFRKKIVFRFFKEETHSFNLTQNIPHEKNESSVPLFHILLSSPLKIELRPL